MVFFFWKLQHDDVLDDGDVAARPEGAGVRRREGQVALEHVDRILLEREDGAVVQHAEQGHDPESAVGKDLADVADLERVVLLLGLAGLAVELLVHEEVDDGHDEGDAEQHHAEGDRTGHFHLAAELGEEGREDHARGDAEAGEGHLGAHREGHLAALEPLDDTAADRDAGHLAAAAEDHEAAGGQLGRSGHPAIERRHAELVEARDVVEVLGEPGLEAAACEAGGHGVPLDEGADEHHAGREDGGEADAHLVEDDTREDEEEDENVEEHLGALHRAECGGVPAAGLLHQVLDRGEDVHENIGAEHRQREKQQGGPTHAGGIAQRLLDFVSHHLSF